MEKNAAGPWPLRVLKGDEYKLTLITAQGNHYATTFDPSAARLISAAPDLLAVAKEALFCYEAFARTKNGPLAKKLRAAIAKAESTHQEA